MIILDLSYLKAFYLGWISVCKHIPFRIVSLLESERIVDDVGIVGIVFIATKVDQYDVLERDISTW